MISNKPVIFFDGVCGLCNKFVDFLIVRDKKHIFLFAPLQGVTAKQMLPPIADMESVIFLETSGLSDKSTAAIRILIYLGGIWILAGIFLAVPKFIRDPIYNVIAKNRYKMFGKKESCRIPTPEERARFLD
jgi:predicted DCC family thiol-disulfide oxidoreductase YuxK